jgi:putative membrane protein
VLPASEGWERFHPLTPLLTTWRFVVVGLFFGLQQMPTAMADTPLGPLIGGGLVLAAGAGGYGYLSWRFAGYRLLGDQLEIQRGILFKSQGNVPIARIESVDLAQTAVPRAVGLAEVVVEVASQGGGEAALKYLSLEDARALRHRLDDARRGASIEAGSGVEAQPSTVPLAAVDDRDLLFAYGVGPAIGAAAVFTGAIAVVVISGVQALLAFGIFGLIAIVTTVATQVRRVDRLHGFVISRGSDELHITRGFVEKLTQQIPLARIQAIRIDEPWLWRRFGRARLQVSVAGYRGADPARAEATAILMPVAPRAEIDRLVETLGGPPLRDVPMTGPPRSARWRSPWRWRHTRIGHAPGFTIVHRGWMGRTTDYVTAAKLQSLRTTSGPWQRRLGLATLHLDTAGSGIVVAAPHLPATGVEHELWTSRSGAGA